MTRHNLCTNPALKNNNTGWGGGSTPARSTGLTGFPDRSTGASYTSGTFMAGPVAAVTAGQTLTFSIYARSNSFNVNSGTIYIQWDNGSTASTGYTLTAGVVTRVSITTTVPASRTSAQLIMDGQNYASSSGDYSELLYEVAGSADTYFDGDTASASWDGADGNSASTLTTGVSGDVSMSTATTITATGTNSAVGAASRSTTTTITATGVNSAVGGASRSTTTTITATGTNAAVGAASGPTTATTITATGVNAAAGAANATTTATAITATAVVGSVVSMSTATAITAAATVTQGVGGPRTGVMGWDLWSTLAQQASYIDYYRTVPPVACPNDGEPLRSGPSAKTGILYCPWGDFQYPRDWDPDTMGGY